jgi:hypothetical protein
VSSASSSTADGRRNLWLRRVSVSFGSPIERLGQLVILGAAGIASLAFGAPLVLMAIPAPCCTLHQIAILVYSLLGLTCIWTLIRWMDPPTVTVGVDGFAIRGFRNAFVLWVHVKKISGGHIIEAELSDKLRVKMSGSFLGFQRADQINLLCKHMELMSSVARSAPEIANAYQIARNGRSIAQWADEGAAAIAVSDGFRSSSLDREDVLGLLEHPGIMPELRLGAALWLLKRGTADDRARVLAVADVCASDAMQTAIRSAEQGTLSEEQCLAACAVGTR